MFLKRLCKKCLVAYGLFLVFLVLSIGTDLSATGFWVEQTLSDFSGGSVLCDSDEGCLVYTRNNTDVILVFDVNRGDWLKIDMGTSQSFCEAVTKGNVVFARTDSLLFGYSATLQEWDTITFTGDYMTGITYYSECGRNLACFVTQSYVYVFDADLGYWQTYDYGLPVDFTGGSVWVADTYIGMKLSIPYPGEPKNIVYSGLVHNFNKIELGVHQPSPVTEYGFAGWFNIDYDGVNYRFVGYSAATNQFDVVSYALGNNEGPISLTGAGTLTADMFTTRVFGFRHIVPNTSVTTNWYGFDTRRGAWDHEQRFYDWTVDHYSGNICQAGQFSFDNSLFTADASFHFQFYSGIDGVYRDFTPGLIYTSTTASWGGGGTVFCAHDNLNAWGYDVAGNRSSAISLPLDKTSYLCRGEDFAAFTRYETGVDTMITFFYNSNNNSWSSVSAPDHHTTHGTSNEHLYIHRGSGENVVIFYSAHKDLIHKEDFPDDISVYTLLNDEMGWARSANASVLFDALNGSAFTYGFNFDRSSMGTHSAILCNTTAQTVHGYSCLTQNQSEQVIDFEPYFINESGYIGYIDNAYNNTKCYAYNELGDGWVELIPEGSDVATLVGTKTILVARHDRVYAFDPESLTVSVEDDIEEEESPDLLPYKFELFQNYPNPFNPSTTIHYSIPERSHVTLDIFDVSGRRIARLVDSVQESGGHHKEWYGWNKDGAAVSSGVYFYKLRAGKKRITKKMILLK